MDSDAQLAMSTGLQILRIISPFYIIISVKIMADGVLRGIGRMNQFMVATFTDLILRVILAIVLSKLLGVVGIWIAWPIGWTIATCVSLIFYKQVKFDRAEI